MKKEILKKIEDGTVRIGIMGLGYVGLPLAVSFAQSKKMPVVLGFDTDVNVAKLANGQSYVKDVSNETLEDAMYNRMLILDSDKTMLKECDAIIICVPTPLDKFKKPDLSFVREAMIEVGKNMKKGVFICLESTTYPTTSEGFIEPLLSEVFGKKYGRDYWLGYSPERVDPNNKVFNTINTPKLLGAITKDGLEIGKKLYELAIDNVVTVSSPRVAEMAKILENTYRLVNISLINELALLAGKMEIDIWEVINAAGTKPFGFQPFYPSAGIGGHCIPLDPFYLEHIAKKYDFDLTMIHTAGHINMRMPYYMSVKVASALNSVGKSIQGSRILFLGVAYKPDIDDFRESAAVKIMEIAHEKGAKVSYYDPHVPVLTGHGHRSEESLNVALKGADCVVVCVKHSEFDSELVFDKSKLIVDLCNFIDKPHKKVFKL